MRYTIEETASAVGLSVPQTRRRLQVLERHVDDVVSRGDHRKLFLSERGLSLLRRAVEIERDHGLAPQQAAKDALQQAGNVEQNGEKTPIKLDHDGVIQELIAALRAQIRDLEDDRNEWRRLAVQLQTQVPIALPAKTEDRRPWFLRLLTASPR